MTLRRLSLGALAIIIVVALIMVTFGGEELEDPELRTLLAEHRTLVAVLTATAEAEPGVDERKQTPTPELIAKPSFSPTSTRTHAPTQTTTAVPVTRATTIAVRTIAPTLSPTLGVVPPSIPTAKPVPTPISTPTPTRTPDSMPTPTSTTTPEKGDPKCLHLDDDSAIRAIPVDSDDGYVETVVISAGRTLNAIQYFDGGGDLVKEEIYDQGIVRMELIYQNSKLRQ